MLITLCYVHVIANNDGLQICDYNEYRFGKDVLTQHVVLKVLLLIEQLHVSATVLRHHQVVTLPISISAIRHPRCVFSNEYRIIKDV
jgi:hypothetical protein